MMSTAEVEKNLFHICRLSEDFGRHILLIFKTLYILEMNLCVRIYNKESIICEKSTLNPVRCERDI